MNVSLTPQLEEMINKKVETGLYQSASEVVRAGLRLLEEQDRTREQRLEELRREIALGIKDIEEGRYSVIDENTASEIETMGRKKLAEKMDRKPRP